ncbi:sensor histidine kinase [Paenibacillus planticolens]|uniref:histidine kinase n=1 Tax=Paenibacillus planticolens TaxID=2654976 RepID=A0ABX1ZMX1_9BACL|nr:sensor histidine kinase [Paenibacillus planticolens]NOV01412.1 sensor histidine kinase [Paenibacillus planticolens]
MKRLFLLCWIGVLIVMVCSGCIYSRAHVDEQTADLKAIPEWSILWGDPPDGLEGVMSAASDRWMKVTKGQPFSEKPEHISTVWIKFQLPSHLPKDYGIYIQDISTQKLKIYIGTNLIRETVYDFPYDAQRSLFQVGSEESGETIYLKLESTMDRLNIYSAIKIDQYATLMRAYVLQDLQNIVFGTAFLFIALIMLIGSIFLKRGQLQSWILISVLSLSVGIIFITYSPFVYANFPSYGGLFISSFDIALNVFLPTLTWSFEQIFDNGKFKWVRRFRKFQVVYSVLLIAFMFINQMNHYQFNRAYFFAAVTVLGYMMIVQFFLIIGLSIPLVQKGNKEAVIFSIGFAMLAGMSILDLINYYVSSQYYQFYLWKWGGIGLFVSLIVILVRRFAMNQELLVNYSKELEFYNHQLQLSERTEIISSLAASVAHEVRNPLQVTRGFLQLMGSRSDEKDKEYMNIAIEELDRASVIITDFLTFSKPQLEEFVDIDVSQVIKQIEGIIMPLATLQGGRIIVSVPAGLYIRGNISKFKQVMINLIKNGIEAFEDDGEIQIRAYDKDSKVYVHIKDNGQGIEAAELLKLGEPYFTTKTKGTGLGLMVTFRIIEAMQGKMEFESEKHKGTEVTMSFPKVKH